MYRKNLSMAAALVVALLAWSALAIAQDTASPNTNQAQSQSDHKRTEATAAESGHNGTKSTEATGNSQVTQSEKKFMMKAAQGGIEEVELGQLVASKTQDNDVKQFAQRMVDDHTKANDELKSLAQQKGVSLPTEMDSTGRALKAKLEKLSGDQLAKTYMRNMVQDHTKDVHEFKMESETAKDPSVKEFASKTLPVLQSHLEEAKKVASKEGVNTSKPTQSAQQ